jgi:hypothetical protein
MSCWSDDAFGNTVSSFDGDWCIRTSDTDLIVGVLSLSLLLVPTRGEELLLSLLLIAALI